MQLTIVGKLVLNQTDKQRLAETLTKFADACNYISQIAFERKCFNPVALHHLTYRDVREKFGLHANLAIRARDRVAKSYKRKEKRNKLHTFKATSLDLDAKLFRVFWKGDELWVSIAPANGKRIKCQIKVGERYLPLLKTTKPTFAVLKRHRNGEFYLHMVVEVPEPPETPPQNIVGVDLGEVDLLVASNGFKVSGWELKERRKQFRARRSALQRKGTKGKRALKRLSGKERRWARTMLHTISRRFVDSLPRNSLVVLEDLTGIRENAKRNGSEQRADFHSWAFRQLQFLIAYKARLAGHQVVFVDPKHTSQTCPRCQHVSPSNRLSVRLFRCEQCGFQHNANFVASVNLACRAAQAGLGGAGLLSTSLMRWAFNPSTASRRL